MISVSAVKKHCANPWDEHSAVLFFGFDRDDNNDNHPFPRFGGCIFIADESICIGAGGRKPNRFFCLILTPYPMYWDSKNVQPFGQEQA